jgi:hypothetical protein
MFIGTPIEAVYINQDQFRPKISIYVEYNRPDAEAKAKDVGGMVIKEQGQEKYYIFPKFDDVRQVAYESN